MLKITKKELPKCTILAIEGDIEIENEIAFRKKVVEAADEKNLPLVLDFEKVNFIDSGGLGVLITLLFEYKRRGKPIKIYRPNPSIELILTNFINCDSMAAVD